MVDVFRLLYLAAVLSPAAAPTVIVVPRGSHDDPVAVRRHADALRITPGYVEAQLVTPAGVRVVHEESPHLLGVEDVGATAASGH